MCLSVLLETVGCEFWFSILLQRFDSYSDFDTLNPVLEGLKNLEES